jgi:hypothetical protein
MNDRRDDGVMLSSKSERSIESAAKEWAKEVRIKLGECRTAEQVVAALNTPTTPYMPSWCEYDQDYSDFDDACIRQYVEHFTAQWVDDAENDSPSYVLWIGLCCWTQEEGESEWDSRAGQGELPWREVVIHFAGGPRNGETE